METALSVDSDANLFEVGLTLFDLVSVVAALEERLGVPLPDELFTAEKLSSVGAIEWAFAKIRGMQREPHQ